MQEIEKLFQTTALLLFGKKLEGLDSFGDWLGSCFPSGIRFIKSVKSNKQVCVPPVYFFQMMENNMVTLDESLELGSLKLTEEQVGNLTLENASNLLSGIKTTTCEIVYGQNLGTEQCAGYGPTQHCYRSVFNWFAKHNGYAFMARTSESVFGCSNILDCQFSMRCFNSAKLVRCFEVADSNNCKDSYFCYNCENLENCLFCFNTKSKRYAIANIEVGKEKYLEIKKKICEQVFAELEQTKKLDYGIFNLCHR
ncbi:MAG: hypothetical protein AABW86_00790 [Candidatus Micrarchaeota archaeon]